MPLTAGHLETNHLFGIYTTQLTKTGNLALSSLSRQNYQQIAEQWIQAASFTSKAPLISPAEAQFYVSEYMNDEFFDKSVWQAYSSETSIEINDRLSQLRSFRFIRPQDSVTFSQGSTIPRPQAKKDYMRRDSEKTESYQFWKTPYVVYMRNENAGTPAYLGPDTYTEDDDLTFSIIYVAKWLYYDVPYAVVKFLIEAPLSIILLITLGVGVVCACLVSLISLGLRKK